MHARYVVDVMSPRPVVVGATDTVWHAAEVAESAGVHHLLVLRRYALVGELCLCDVYFASGSTVVSERMRRHLVTIDDQATVDVAAQVMMQAGVGCLPVLGWCGELRGIVTRSDLRRVGALSVRCQRRCASCGSTHGLGCDRAESVTFCFRCVLETRQVESTLDELYVTLGGG